MSIERIFSAVSPQSTIGTDAPGRDALLDFGLSCQGLPDTAYHALLWRFLRDEQSFGILYSRLAEIAAKGRAKTVRGNAGRLARLVLAEEHLPLPAEYSGPSGRGRIGYIDKLGIGPALMGCSDQEWARYLRPEFLRLRARFAAWISHGTGMIAARLRDG